MENQFGTMWQLKWLNKFVTQAPIVTSILPLRTAIMAFSSGSPFVSTMGHLPMPDTELPFAEDIPKVEGKIITRPPGVQTLRQWGEQVFPEGKHKGKTFHTVYHTDLKYRSYMKSYCHLTSGWPKSFQNYILAMEQVIVTSVAIPVPVASPGYFQPVPVLPITKN